MILSTVLAATLATQPAPAVDHSKMDHMKMDVQGAKAAPKMDCCKDGCACCAKDKVKPAA